MRQRGIRIVQSHGVFDLVHPGHILHLKEARSFGDLLVVTVSADEFVGKGPGRPYFNEALRVEALSALSCVDHIVVIPYPGPEHAIACVRPSYYCKGKEYQDANYSPSGTIELERALVEENGGELRFAGGIKYSSTKILNKHFDHLGSEVRGFCEQVSRKFPRQTFISALRSLQGLKVLVMGDTIFDRYSEVAVQGLTSKNRILSGRFLKEETHPGGALAVYRHVREFAGEVRYLSLTGAEPWSLGALNTIVPTSQNFSVCSADYTTVLKQRFVEPSVDNGIVSKLFSINYLTNDPPSEEVAGQLEKQTMAAMKGVDAVLLLDFGHGMMQEPLRNLVQEKARLLILNCQTNSNNHGFNVINRQYQRADAFSVDQQELLLAVGRREVDYETELGRLKIDLKADYAWLTRGAVNTIGLHTGEDTCICPPLGRMVRDTVGAGDAFFSLAGLSAAAGLPVEIGTFLGQLAGDQAVQVMGNATSVSKQALESAGLALLNF